LILAWSRERKKSQMGGWKRWLARSSRGRGPSKRFSGYHMSIVGGFLRLKVGGGRKNE